MKRATQFTKIIQVHGEQKRRYNRTLSYTKIDFKRCYPGILSAVTKYLRDTLRLDLRGGSISGATFLHVMFPRHWIRATIIVAPVYMVSPPMFKRCPHIIETKLKPKLPASFVISQSSVFSVFFFVSLYFSTNVWRIKDIKNSSKQF